MWSFHEYLQCVPLPGPPPVVSPPPGRAHLQVHPEEKVGALCWGFLVTLQHLPHGTPLCQYGNALLCALSHPLGHVYSAEGLMIGLVYGHASVFLTVDVVNAPVK